VRLVMADLAELDAGDERFGGKARGLARLLAAGARVPAGFALALGAPGPSRWRAAERAAFRRRVAALLAAGPLAVRSSARAEDGGERSFAGLFESVLGVRDAAEVEQAVERCIASAGSDRVRAYGGSEGAAAMGIVVQHLVEARASGVLFTADPKGAHRGSVLEAVSGSGEALVSGQRPPERWSVHLSGQGRFEALREAGADGLPLLAPREAERLAREALVLAETLGEPLDLEWAADAGGRIWWLQARPITARRAPPPLPQVARSCPDAREGPVSVWTRLNLRETLPEPLTPLAWSFWRDCVLPVFGRVVLDFPPESSVRQELQMADLVEGRLYFNLNAMLGMGLFGVAAGSMLDAVDAEWSSGFAAVRHVVTPRAIPAGRFLRARAALRSARRNLAALRRAARPERALAELEAWARSMRERAHAPLARRSERELLAEVREVTGPGLLDASLLFAGLIYAVGAFALAKRLFRAHPEAQSRLAVGIPGNPTTAISAALDDLAIAARPLADLFLRPMPPDALFAELAASAEGRAWLERFEVFLEENGQRGPGEFDLRVPRWAEDPSMLLDWLRAELREPAKEGARERLARLAAERETAIARAVAESPAWRRPLLRYAARLAARHLPLREAGKHHALHAWLRSRRLLVEVGARLAAEGWIDDGADVFFLELPELEAAAEGRLDRRALRDRVEGGRALHAGFAERSAPAFLRSDGVPVDLAQPESPDGALRGTGISTGAAVGAVRVLERPDAGALVPGEVLVVRLADPGWTPLFSRAGALVMEVGGLMCHAAVVARELGVPAVFGVRGATERLRNGDRVCVDADAGTVTPL
jgi:rifampicin phosphotransferase